MLVACPLLYDFFWYVYIWTSERACVGLLCLNFFPEYYCCILWPDVYFITRFNIKISCFLSTMYFCYFYTCMSEQTSLACRALTSRLVYPNAVFTARYELNN
jgi:hypothetical protein